MQIIMVGIGSYGDIYPLVGLGRSLKNRGHHVTLLANACFNQVAKDAGLSFDTIGSAAEYAEFNTKLNHRRRLKVLCDHLYLRPMKPVYDFLQAKANPSNTITVCNISALGARLAREKCSIPMVSVNMSPMMFMSSHDFPLYFTKPYPKWLPKIFYRIAAGAIHRTFDRRLSPAVNALRHTLGLPPQRDILSWMVSPDKLVGLFPSWFGNPQPDWPVQTELSGFPLFDEGALYKQPISREINAFLDQGPAPILFTPGTPNDNSSDFFTKAVAAVKALNARALLLTPFRDQVPDELPSSILHADYAPFSKIFDRCALLVHHGGIGTVAQALRAGRPQLIVPWGVDQYDNGGRIKALGAGDVINIKKCTPRTLAETIDHFLNHKTVSLRCRKLANDVRTADASADFCRIVEGMRKSDIDFPATTKEKYPLSAAV